MVRIRLSHYTDLLRIGMPIMMGQMSTIIMGLADTLMVGRYGTNELAAAGFVNNILGLLIIGGMGSKVGSSRRRTLAWALVIRSKVSCNQCNMS